MGALANEGGLRREDFGHIDIRLDHTLVELPVHLPQHAWDALKSTRISGKLIELTPARAESLDRDRPRRKPAGGGYGKGSTHQHRQGHKGMRRTY